MRHGEARSHPRNDTDFAIARNEAIHGLPRFARNDEVDCRASLAMTIHGARHNE
jgi:hypothetical protein